MALSDNPAWINALSRAPDAVELRPLNTTRATMLVLSISVFLLILWAGLTPVNEVASSYGQITPSGHVQVIQHLEGGMIQKINVKEGDRVKKNDVLMVMNPTSVLSDVGQLKQERLSLQMERERTQAYLEKRTLDFSALEGVDATMIADQDRAYESAQHSKEREAQVVRTQITQRQQALRAAQARSSMLAKNIGLADESLGIKQQLYQKGYYSRLNYLDKQEQVNSMRGEQAALAQEIQRTRSEIDEYQTRLSSLEATTRERSYDDLNRLNNDIAKIDDSIAKFDDRVARLEVRAPMAGIVKGIEINTIGGIVAPGQKLMELVPLDGPLNVEARILPSDIGQLHVGLPVKVKVHAFDYTRYGTMNGTLQNISATTFVDEKNQNYYRGTITLSRSYAGNAPAENLLMPGMTVDAEIITGARSLLSYLLTPVRRAADTAFTER